jgi:hypothetical protein
MKEVDKNLQRVVEKVNREIMLMLIITMINNNNKLAIYMETHTILMVESILEHIILKEVHQK